MSRLLSLPDHERQQISKRSVQMGTVYCTTAVIRSVVTHLNNGNNKSAYRALSDKVYPDLKEEGTKALFDFIVLTATPFLLERKKILLMDQKKNLLNNEISTLAVKADNEKTRLNEFPVNDDLEWGFEALVYAAILEEIDQKKEEIKRL